jgi:predicted O-methyltransferase YrrM
MPTADDYRTAFVLESRNVYPCVDEFEQASGYALERSKLEAAARVLACPVKKNPPCWQHGRILYAATRARLHGIAGPVNILEIGTAKGFGALCLLWAMQDANHHGQVTSVDVIGPKDRIKRNTVVEIDCTMLLTLRETLSQWPESSLIDFQQSTGVDYLLKHEERIHVAFIDGKHSGPVVSQEGWLISHRQQPGDVALFDDVHLAPVERSVNDLRSVYEFQRFDLLPERALMLGVRK